MSLTPKTVREQVTNQIRDELLAGHFEVGTMLREVELANRFGVSRGPVRDAFIQLSQEGYLAYHANRGVMVRRPPKPEDREFIKSLRQQIEVYVVRQGLSKAADDGIEKVATALAELKVACEAQDAARVAVRDLEFHEAALLACDGEDLVSPWRQLCSRMWLNYTRLNDYSEAYAEHVAIYEALAARNVDAAVNALMENIK